MEVNTNRGRQNEAEEVELMGGRREREACGKQAATPPSPETRLAPMPAEPLLFWLTIRVRVIKTTCAQAAVAMLKDNFVRNILPSSSY